MVVIILQTIVLHLDEGAGKRGTLQIEEVSKSGIAEVKVDELNW